MDSVLGEVRSVIGDVLDRGDGSWRALQESGLLALVASKEHGGEGLGMAEVAVLLHEVGRRASDLPVWETVACGLLPLVRSGPDSLQADLVPQVLAGELLFAPALGEPGTALPRDPATTYDDGGVTGTKIGVPVLDREDLSARVPTGGVAIVDPEGPGVSRVDTPTSRGAAEATYIFTSAPALGVLDADVVRSHAVAGLAALGAGLVEGARDLTAGYIRDRRQFGRALAEFQAVAQQIADVYIASRTFTLTAGELARRLDAGDPAADDLAVAAHWFADRAPAVLQTCQHLHGGMGVDITYPLNRYFSGVRDAARHLGGPAALADVPVTETDGKNAELTAEERAFKQEARAYLSGLTSDADRDEMRTDRHGPVYHRTIKQMGADGWMGVGWPKEYGGQGCGVIEQQVFVNEASRADVHLPSVTLQTVGPTLQAYGTQKQKDMFLADIVTGDVHFAIGYSEPDAGTDLASMRTSARRTATTTSSTGRRCGRPAATRPTTSGSRCAPIRRATAPRHLGADRRHPRPRLLSTPIVTSDPRTTRTRRTTTTYAAGRHARRRGEPRLAAHHDAAQPRAGHARAGRTHRGPAPHRARVGAGPGGTGTARRCSRCRWSATRSRAPPRRSASTSCSTGPLRAAASSERATVAERRHPRCWRATRCSVSAGADGRRHDVRRPGRSRDRAVGGLPRRDRASATSC